MKVIAPNGYTNSAKNLAEANNIKLIHHSEINFNNLLRNFIPFKIFILNNLLYIFIEGS